MKETETIDVVDMNVDADADRLVVFTTALAMARHMLSSQSINTTQFALRGSPWQYAFMQNVVNAFQFIIKTVYNDAYETPHVISYFGFNCEDFWRITVCKLDLRQVVEA